MGLCSGVFARSQKHCVLGWQTEIAKTSSREVNNMWVENGQRSDAKSEMGGTY